MGGGGVGWSRRHGPVRSMADCRGARRFDNAAGIATVQLVQTEAALRARGTLQPIVFSLKKAEKAAKGGISPSPNFLFFHHPLC